MSDPFHPLSDAEVYETARRDGSEIIECNDDFVIDLVPMLFNWRIHVTMREDYGNFYHHGYCYFGRDLATRERARNAALAWARTSALDTKPEGYDKEAF